MDQTVLFLGMAALLVVIVGGVLLYARSSNKQAAELIPPDIAKRAFDLSDQILLATLPSIASSGSKIDDEVALTYLRMRGWTITGSPETGYTASREAKDQQ